MEPIYSGSQPSWERIRGWMNDAAKAAAGVISPPADSPGAAAIAGIRSMLPGGDSFEVESRRYNQAAAPSPLYSADSRFGSVVKAPDAPWWQQSAGEAERGRTLADQSNILGHILGHGTGAIWAPEPGAPLGQFHRSYKHTGEGGAYKGAGGYAAEAMVVPEKYRTGLSEPEVRPLTSAAHPTTDAQLEAFDQLRRWILDARTEYGRMPDKGSTLAEWRNGIAYRATQAEADAAKARQWHEKRPEYADKIKEYGETPIEQVLEAEAKAKAARDLADWAKTLGGKDIDFSAGSLYVLDFPDELMPKVLDFDLPFGQQSPEVQRSLLSVTPLRNETAKMARSDSLIGKPTYTRMPEPTPAEIDAFIAKYPSGEGIYHAIVDAFGGKDAPGAAEAASRALAEAGIPAHKFWDQASRDAATGTKNFVVYDPDKHLKTVSRFGSLDEMNEAVRAPIRERLLKKADEAAAQGRNGEAEWIRQHAETFDLQRKDYEAHFKNILEELKRGESK